MSDVTKDGKLEMYLTPLFCFFYPNEQLLVQLNCFILFIAI